MAGAATILLRAGGGRIPGADVAVEGLAVAVRLSGLAA